MDHQQHGEILNMQTTDTQERERRTRRIANNIEALLQSCNEVSHANHPRWRQTHRTDRSEQYTDLVRRTRAELREASLAIVGHWEKEEYGEAEKAFGVLTERLFAFIKEHMPK
ncbi:hypothetical protein Tdes44962_MAKER08082 [Teratosphaeria destructans]|uniref:Uncharacterized protein n=1 Tax=Teratosphaeria destructans TaxID=418781 RepID=A0A9W7SXF8_9PEZI|nr:hypothetical protein Tdes44962_MAKER08082 [Teratosphaeria destructans]